MMVATFVYQSMVDKLGMLRPHPSIFNLLNTPFLCVSVFYLFFFFWRQQLQAFDDYKLFFLKDIIFLLKYCESPRVNEN